MPAERDARASASPTPEADLEKVDVEEPLPTPVTARPVADDFPDGGWAAWSQVIGGFPIAFVCWGWVNSYGAEQAYLQSDLLSSNPPSTNIWIGGLQVAGLYFHGIWTGKLFDRGYLRHLIAFGSLVYVLCFFLLPQCTKLWHFILCQGFGIGLALGCLYVPAISTLNHYWRKRRTFALGVLTCGASLGGIVYPIQLRAMLKSVGFPWSIRTSAFITLACLIPPNLLLRTRLQPKKETGPLLDFSAFNNLPYSLFVAGGTCIMFAQYLVYFYNSSFSLHSGIDPDLSFYSLAILNAASVLGRLIPNYFADKTGPINMLIPLTLASAVLLFVWTLTDNVAGQIVYVILFGFFSGAFVSSIPACIASITVDMCQIGTRIGGLFLCLAAGAIAGPPANGALIGQDGTGYFRASMFNGAVCTLGVALITLARHIHVRRTGNRKT